MRHAGLLIRHQHARIFFSPAAARVRLDVESRSGTDFGSWDAGNSASSRDTLNLTWLRLDSRGLEKDYTRSAHRPSARSENLSRQQHLRAQTWIKNVGDSFRLECWKFCVL
ncbi:unnamed protein product [Sphagnum jensenii]|uniref:Uncharacterized protein n=1 Tax=Sphagnum jensenii TaxID=128206 RepID=A0ABP0XHK7_9BRYO